MLRGTRLVALTATLSVALLVTGCTGTPVEVKPAPPAQSSSTASSTALLRAGKIAYKNYLNTVDRATETQSNSDLKALVPLVSGDLYEQTKASVEQAKRQGVRAVGRTKLVAFKAQQVSQSAQSVSAYVCLDFENVRVLNESRNDVTPRDRASLQQYLVRLQVAKQEMIVLSEGAWSGSDVC